MAVIQAPVTPAEAQGYIIKESDSVCTALVKLQKIAVALWKMAKFKYTITGTLTPEYRSMMCAADCPSPDAEGSGTSSNPPT